MQEQVQKVEDLIKGEVNVKEFEYLTETEGFIKKKVKPNFKSLGAKMGAKMKAVAAVTVSYTHLDVYKRQVLQSLDLPAYRRPGARQSGLHAPAPVRVSRSRS